MTSFAEVLRRFVIELKNNKVLSGSIIVTTLSLFYAKLTTLSIRPHIDTFETFQDPATPVMDGIINLHHDVFFFCVIILIFVLWMFVKIIIEFGEHSGVPHQALRITHGTTLEVVWTVIPAVILLLIAMPSFALLYSIDEPVNPALTVKVIGHQWYWTYEYSDYQTTKGEPIIFDSYMIPDADLTKSDFRLLEVDNRVVLPINTHVRVLVTAADVLHSWAVPSLGVKMDAVPGRLNQLSMYIKKPGIYYGQCSEICGVNHGFMPICVEAVSLKQYIGWVTDKIQATDWFEDSKQHGN